MAAEEASKRGEGKEEELRWCKDQSSRTKACDQKTANSRWLRVVIPSNAMIIYQHVFPADSFTQQTPWYHLYALKCLHTQLSVNIFLNIAKGHGGGGGFCITIEHGETLKSLLSAGFQTRIHHLPWECQISSTLNRWLASRCQGASRREIEVMFV